MTENHDLAPEADVEEQEQPVIDADDNATGVETPLDADPADFAEQSTSVPLDEDDEPRPD